MKDSMYIIFFTVALFLILSIPMSASASSIVIDFEADQDSNPLSAGTLISNQYDDLFTLSVWSSRRGSQSAMIFDTDNFTGGDNDLAVNVGNAIIISEDGDASDPDDEARGGRFIFDFTNDISEFGLTILDIENPANNTITLFDGTDSSGPISLSSFGLTGWGDASIVTINPFSTSFYGLNQVDKIEIAVSTSAAIGDVSISPVPEPATMLLFGTGIAGLAAIGRRRKKI